MISLYINSSCDGAFLATCVQPTALITLRKPALASNCFFMLACPTAVYMRMWCTRLTFGQIRPTWLPQLGSVSAGSVLIGGSALSEWPHVCGQHQMGPGRTWLRSLKMVLGNLKWLMSQSFPFADHCSIDTHLIAPNSIVVINVFFCSCNRKDLNVLFVHLFIRNVNIILRNTSLDIISNMRPQVPVWWIIPSSDEGQCFRKSRVHF